MEGGLRLWTSGHLQKLEFYARKSPDTTKVRAEVLAAMATRKTNAAAAELSRENGTILRCKCECRAGSGEVCKHVVCVFYALSYIATHDLKVVPEEKACTEGERQWYHSRKPLEVKKNVEQLEFVKDTCARVSGARDTIRKRKAYESLPEERRNVERLRLIHLVDLLRTHGLGFWADILESNDFTPNELQAVNPTDTQTCVESTVPTLMDMISQSPVPSTEDVYEQLCHLHSSQTVTDIENATKEQNSSEWHQHRKGVITASVCYRVYTRVHTIRNKYGPHNVLPLLNQICGKAQVITRVMQDGIDMEPKAKEVYLQLHRKHTDHREYTIEELGLVLHESYPFIGCSPDVLLQCKCETKLVEIKCPKGMKAFMDSYTVNGKKVKRTNVYFAQVQMQMDVCKVDTCDLFVHDSEGEIFVITVPFDRTFYDDLVERCVFFFKEYILPYLLREKTVTV
ncbi:uncharacterized protein LOC135366067 isoform X2 [Ornithodoros turicata]